MGSKKLETQHSFGFRANKMGADETVNQLVLFENQQMQVNVEDLCQWLSKVIGEELRLTKENFFQKLADGIILCQLANSIQEYAIKAAKGSENSALGGKIKYKSSKLCKMDKSKFHARENVSKFLDWCRSHGIVRAALFESNDIVVGGTDGGREVIICLMSLAKRFSVDYYVPAPETLKVEVEREIMSKKDKILEKTKNESSPKDVFQSKAKSAGEWLTFGDQDAENQIYAEENNFNDSAVPSYSESQKQAQYKESKENKENCDNDNDAQINTFLDEKTVENSDDADTQNQGLFQSSAETQVDRTSDPTQLQDEQSCLQDLNKDETESTGRVSFTDAFVDAYLDKQHSQLKQISNDNEGDESQTPEQVSPKTGLAADALACEDHQNLATDDNEEESNFFKECETFYLQQNQDYKSSLTEDFEMLQNFCELISKDFQFQIRILKFLCIQVGGKYIFIKNMEGQLVVRYNRRWVPLDTLLKKKSNSKLSASNLPPTTSP